MRLANLGLPVSNGLKNYIKSAIQDLGEKPEQVLDRARGITEEAIKFILQTEGLTGEAFPEAWKKLWVETLGLSFPQHFDPLPTDRGPLCSVIRHITGCTPNYRRVAKTISRQSSVLLDQMSSFGNLRNHRHHEETRFGMACAMCFTAIELLSSLAEDVEPEKPNN